MKAVLIVALALALAVSQPATVVASVLSDTLAGISGDFTDICNKLGPYLPLPEVNAQQFCQTTGFSKDRAMCAFLDVTERGLMMLDKSSGRVCNADKQTPVPDQSLTGASLPYPLSDQRPLPKTLDATLLGKEGATYYWIWKNLLNFELWAGCAATNTPQTATSGTPTSGSAAGDWLQPPGWDVDSTLWLSDGTAASGQYWPFATIINKTDSLVIFIRGTETQQDWLTDFNYNTTRSRTRSHISMPGRVHQGIAAVADTLWPSMQAALQRLLEEQSTKGTIKNVYIAGHSLGAGVATLVSYAVQSYVKYHRLSTKVDAMLFAPPNVGDPLFAALYGRVVNARRIPFVSDLIPQVPCTPTMIGCKNAVIPTGTRGNGTWPYASVPGTLMLQPSGMPQQADAWALLNKIYPCQLSRFLRATHICSYNCYLSQYVSDVNNLCQLWDVSGTGGPAGSYCYQFPVTSGPQYPYKL